MQIDNSWWNNWFGGRVVISSKVTWPWKLQMAAILPYCWCLLPQILKMVRRMSYGSLNAVIRIKVRLNSVSCSKLLSNIVYRSSHFSRKFDIWKLSGCFSYRASNHNIFFWDLQKLASYSCFRHKLLKMQKNVKTHTHCIVKPIFTHFKWPYESMSSCYKMYLFSGCSSLFSLK